MADAAVARRLHEISERADWLVHHWTEPAFGRPPHQDEAIMIARQDVPWLVAELRAALARLETAEHERDELRGYVEVARRFVYQTRPLLRIYSNALGGQADDLYVKLGGDALLALVGRQPEAGEPEAKP